MQVIKRQKTVIIDGFLGGSGGSDGSTILPFENAITYAILFNMCTIMWCHHKLRKVFSTQKCLENTEYFCFFIRMKMKIVILSIILMHFPCYRIKINGRYYVSWERGEGNIFIIDR